MVLAAAMSLAVVEEVRSAVIVQSHDDLWQLSQGNMVTSTTATLGGTSGGNLFGGSAGVEPGNVLFSDSFDVGHVHAVEWQTMAPVEVLSFSLFAQHEGFRFSPNELTTQQRGISEFRLLAFNSDMEQFEQVYSISMAGSYGETVAPPGSLIDPGNPGYSLALAADIDPVTAQLWRAEFIQAGDRSTSGIDVRALGPRIMELDAFGTLHPVMIPEPGVGALFAAGALALLVFARRRSL
mgnify:CR=1 FL=1